MTPLSLPASIVEPRRVGMARSGALAAASSHPVTGHDPGDAYVKAAAKWEAEVRALEQLDRSQPDPEGSVLAVGSSSIRLWETMAGDLAPFPVVRRGVGGALISDLVVHGRRLIHPHRPRAIVFYAGSNDVVGDASDKPPGEIVRLASQLVGTARENQARVPVLFLEISPAPSRIRALDRIRATNRALQAFCQETPGVVFVPTWTHFLAPSGELLPELFRDDRLHLRPVGYQIWARLLLEQLRRL